MLTSTNHTEQKPKLVCPCLPGRAPLRRNPFSFSLVAVAYPWDLGPVPIVRNREALSLIEFRDLSPPPRARCTCLALVIDNNGVIMMLINDGFGLSARLRTEFTDLSNYHFGCACSMQAVSSQPFCFGVDFGSARDGERLELWLVDSSLFFSGNLHVLLLTKVIFGNT